MLVKDLRQKFLFSKLTVVIKAFVVSKVFEKFINDKLVKHLKCVDLFLDFRYGFRSSTSTADLTAVVTERIARSLTLSGATRAIALDIFKAFDRV